MMPLSRKTGSLAIRRQGILVSAPHHPRRYRPNIRFLPVGMHLLEQGSRASLVQVQQTGSDRIQTVLLAMMLVE